jgi:D-cysteine desulfhydrase
MAPADAAPAEVWVKREDLAPTGLGGNKLRNLEFLVGAALEEGADTLVTAGRRWSNHCRLAAAAGAMAGLEVHLVLTGPAPSTPGPSQLFAELCGATVHFTRGPDRAERERTVEQLGLDLRARRRRLYAIPVGGAGSPGTAGQLLAGLELTAQLREHRASADIVMLASATGATQAGLLVGLRMLGLGTPLLGFAVARPAIELRPVIETMAIELAGLVGLDTAGSDRSGPSSLQPWLEDRPSTSYGVRSAEAVEAAALLARTEGIAADPIYTAKALAGLVAEAKAGRLAGRSVVFWHGGGTTGLFETLDG